MSDDAPADLKTPTTTAVTKTTVESTVDTTGDLPPLDESAIFGVSIRSWLAIMFATTICTMSLMNREITEPLYGLGYVAIGFFFGKAANNPTRK